MSTHKARVAKIDSVAPINGADKIQTAYVLGVQVIVGKDHKVGDIGVLFDGELQLSHEYCHNNSLYRHSELNIDPDKAGYFDDNRRVRVQKFMKVKSEGVFMPLESLAFTRYDISKLEVGAEFDELNNVKLCEKYISEKTKALLAAKRNELKRIKVITAPLFKEHTDSEQLGYYINTIPVGSVITIEHKWHGTSGRVTYTKIKKLRSFWHTALESLAKIYSKKGWRKYIYDGYIHISNFINNRIGSKAEPLFFQEKWEHLAGSRRVVLFPEHKGKIGFHGPEQYRFDILENFKPYLTKGMTVYFEIVGSVNTSPIMGTHDISKLNDKAFVAKYGKSIQYKYGCLPDEYKVKVYRITLTTDGGDSVDFTSDQVVDWCEKRGFLVSKPLIPRFIYDGDKEKLMKIVVELAERPDKLCEDYVDPSHINEGVVVRVDHGGQLPLFLKYKTFPFKVAEGIAKEKEVDVEDAS